MDGKIRKLISFDMDLVGNDFVDFEVPGEPFAKQRPRAARKGRFITIYTPRETKEYESKVEKNYRKFYGKKQMDGDLAVEIEGIFSIPKSISKSKAELMEEGSIPHNKKPDCDNMGKICLDGLNGVAYKDDAQISTLHIDKRYGLEPMVKILIKKKRGIYKDGTD